MSTIRVFEMMPAVAAILFLISALPGCSTFGRDGEGAGRPVTFDAMPPRSVQTQSLRDVRFRRFVANDDVNQAEWRSEPSIWPIAHPEREVISRFGPRGRFNRMHNGIDIKAPTGTPVAATADGEVTYAGRQSGYGNVVKIDHGDGIESVYAHLNEIGVAVGVSILQGEFVGTVGATGNATTAHIHYEVLIDDQAYDPWLFLPAVEQ